MVLTGASSSLRATASRSISALVRGARNAATASRAASTSASCGVPATGPMGMAVQSQPSNREGRAPSDRIQSNSRLVRGPPIGPPPIPISTRPSATAHLGPRNWRRPSGPGGRSGGGGKTL